MWMLAKNQVIGCGLLLLRIKITVGELQIYSTPEQLLLVVPGLFVIYQPQVDKFYAIIPDAVHSLS